MNRPSHRTRFSTTQRRGLSLVEAVVAIVIVGVMLVSALNTTAISGRGHLYATETYAAHALASQLMTEILQARYEDPEDEDQELDDGKGQVESILAPVERSAVVFGPESDEITGTRLRFEDVDDYHGWSASPPVCKDGTVIPGRDGWTRQVSVRWVSHADPSLVSAVETGLKRITVTVTDRRGRPTELHSLRAKTGLSEQDRAENTKYLSWVGISIQIGPDTETRVSSGATLHNYASFATN